MQDFLKATIQEAGALAQQYFRTAVSVRTKRHPADLVTEADEAVSAFLVEKIHAAYPDHHIYSEEAVDNQINAGAEYEWVIDPIDGTWNFARGIPLWGVMIAVLYRGEQHLAAVYYPAAGELFFAKAGGGAYLNDAAINVNETDSLDYARGYASRVLKYEQGKRYETLVASLAYKNVSILNYGTIVSGCYLASGGIDFMAMNCGFDYDYLAPLLICSEAGAVVTDSDGNPWKRGRQDIVVANQKLHPKILALLSA